MQNVIHTDNNGVETLALLDCGNAGHFYAIVLPETDQKGQFTQTFGFQKGPVAEVGVNGITSEALLAILLHRTTVLNNCKFPCVENEIAISCIEAALAALTLRTANRIERGVEGKNEC